MPELYGVVTDGRPGLAAAPVSPPISISIGKLRGSWTLSGGIDMIPRRVNSFRRSHRSGTSEMGRFILFKSIRKV